MDIDRAIELACVAHRGQKDKSGLPYIFHSLTLMLAMSTEEEQIVAVLHDVVEDTKLTISLVADNEFSESVIEALKCLTRQDREEYGDYIHRVKTNALATKVKLADLTHNMDVKRLGRLTDYDLQRLRKYHEAWEELTCELLTYESFEAQERQSEL